VTVEEGTHQAEREARRRDGRGRAARVAVDQGAQAYLNLRNVPTYRLIKVKRKRA
jgi:hypothetical protein